MGKGGGRVPPDPGFHLTADNHFHIRNKQLTNVSAPVEGTDATTKKFVTDLLKTKASTTYLKNELGKKADKSKLSDYVLKSDLNKAISEILDNRVKYNHISSQAKSLSVIRITEVNTLTRISLDSGFFSGSGFGSLFIEKIA